MHANNFTGIDGIDGYNGFNISVTGYCIVYNDHKKEVEAKHGVGYETKYFLTNKVNARDEF